MFKYLYILIKYFLAILSKDIFGKILQSSDSAISILDNKAMIDKVSL